ncbi:repressor LexA [Ruminococcaceae bacterium YRB3002]|nr:repressor LexA [Ruminococcaceae bacterium YRB3002]
MSGTTSKSAKSIEKVYDFVVKYIHENAMSPSVRDICAGSGLKSTSSVHAYLKKLDEMGRIEYRPGLRRAIILKNQDQDTDEDRTEDINTDIIKLPCIGKITAGVPILAHETYSDDFFYINRSMIDGALNEDEAFVLKVKGDSMIDAGILDGDYLIVRKQSFCEDRDIIAALIEDEATVKRYGKLNGKPYLFPENEAYAPIPFFGENCRILGKVVGLHRYKIS